MTARRILGNFLNLTAGEFIARLVSFAAFAHLARVLGASEFGRIGFVMTVASYLLIPVLQGLDSVGIRDVARDRALGPRYAGAIVTMRLIAALATWTALTLASLFLAPPAMRPLLLLFGLTLFPNALSLKWLFQAVENTRPVALAGIVAQLVFAAGAFTIAGPEKLLLVPVYVVAGELAGALLLAANFGRFRLSFDQMLWRQLFRDSAPLAASTVLGTLLFNFDVLALARFQSSASVGLYTAIYKLIVVFSAPLTLFQLSVFPALSRAHAAQAGLGKPAAPILRYLAAVFVPLPVAGLLFAGPVLRLIFGPEYTAGAATLQILMWALPLIALRSFFRIILVSYKLQALDLRTVLAGAATNVALDLALVPWLNTIGAAIATLSSEIVILLLSYYYVQRRIEPFPVLRHCLRPLGAAGLMLAAGFLLAASPPVLRLAAAGALYLTALFVFRAVTWKEISSL